MSTLICRTRLATLAGIPLAGSAAIASAQALPMPNAFRYGASYDFEVTNATRVVNDAHDQGPISLMVYIWQPLQSSCRG